MRNLILTILCLFTLSVSAFNSVTYNSPFGEYTLTEPFVLEDIQSVSYQSTQLGQMYGIAPQAIGDNAQGSESGSYEDCFAVVSWEVDAPAFGVVLWVITYSDGTSETYYGSFGNAKKYAQEEAKKKANAEAKRKYEDKHAAPIGDSLAPLLIISTIYYKHKRDKHGKQTRRNESRRRSLGEASC